MDMLSWDFTTWTLFSDIFAIESSVQLCGPACGNKSQLCNGPHCPADGDTELIMSKHPELGGGMSVMCCMHAVRINITLFDYL